MQRKIVKTKTWSRSSCRRVCLTRTTRLTPEEEENYHRTWTLTCEQKYQRYSMLFGLLTVNGKFDVSFLQANSLIASMYSSTQLLSRETDVLVAFSGSPLCTTIILPNHWIIIIYNTF